MSSNKVWNIFEFRFCQEEIVAIHIEFNIITFRRYIHSLLVSLATGIVLVCVCIDPQVVGVV